MEWIFFKKEKVILIAPGLGIFVRQVQQAKKMCTNFAKLLDYILPATICSHRSQLPFEGEVERREPCNA